MIRNTKTSRSLALMATVSAIGLLGVAGSARASQTIDNATVTVPGTFASPLVVNNGLFVGVNGTGTLDINNGGVVSTTNCASAQLGQFAGSSGTILIHDPGSHFDNATCGIFVGMAGNGTLTISNGGVLDTHGGSQVGQGVNSVSVATVTGAGSQWNLSALAIGLSGHGTVNVLAGGALTQTACGAVDVGSNNNSVGVINVGGAGSHWANGGCVFHLGDSGSGALNVTAGGVVDGVAGIEVANTQGAGSGSLTISGANSKVTSTGAVDIGEFNVGTLAISGGGVLTDTQGNLGDLNGSSGSATVDGVGSLWTNTSSLGVGRNGAGALSITNGAVVTANSGFTSGSTTGAVTVSGAGSKLTVATSLSLGDRGTSTVSINNGGVVSDASGVAGVNTNAIANITIDGAGSAWNNSTTLDLGNGFNSAVNLVVQNSGQLSDNSAVLEAGNVTVNGPSSVWTNTTTLRVGGSGAGILTINGLANVTAPGGTTLGAGSSSSGVISIGGAVGQAATSPGTLQTPTVVLGAGNGAQGTLNFNHVSVNYLFAPLISGPGKVNVTSGLTIFSADNTYTGLTTIAPGATLQLGNAGATGSIAGNVTDNGTLIFIRSNALSYGGAIGHAAAERQWRPDPRRHAEYHQRRRLRRGPLPADRLHRQPHRQHADPGRPAQWRAGQQPDDPDVGGPPGQPAVRRRRGRHPVLERNHRDARRLSGRRNRNLEAGPEQLDGCGRRQQRPLGRHDRHLRWNRRRRDGGQQRRPGIGADPAVRGKWLHGQWRRADPQRRQHADDPGRRRHSRRSELHRDCKLGDPGVELHKDRPGHPGADSGQYLQRHHLVLRRLGIRQRRREPRSSWQRLALRHQRRPAHHVQFREQPAGPDGGTWRDSHHRRHNADAWRRDHRQRVSD
jgi:T5SS/PEP-CTERM-associated repeat protein